MGLFCSFFLPLKRKSQRINLCKSEVAETLRFLLGPFEGMRLLIPFAGSTAEPCIQPCFYLSPGCLLKTPQGHKAVTSHPMGCSIAGGVGLLLFMELPFHCLSAPRGIITSRAQGLDQLLLVHSTPKDFSPGEISHQRLLGKF